MQPALTLCATARLAEALRTTPPDGKARVWKTPEAMTLKVWLTRQLEEARLCGKAEPATNLDSLGERLLWEQVIADTLPAAAAPLFDIGGMAASAAEAHALCIHWGIAGQLKAYADTLAPETRSFLEWQRRFKKRCQEGGWMDPSRQLEIAVELLCAGALPLPESIVFAGFDRYSPLEERLRQGLVAQGVRVREMAEPVQSHSAPQVIACATRNTECVQVARWAGQCLQHLPAGALIGIVVPDLARVRESLEFALEDVFSSAPASPNTPTRPYNFSLGRPLASLQLVATALRLIALASSHQLPQSDLSALLLDPYWSASESEADTRALLDARMRQDLDAQTRLDDLLRLARRLHAREEVLCPALLKQLNDFSQGIVHAGSKRRLPSAWAQVFAGWLDALRWPGERSLSSDEFQARERFFATLDALGRLDAILGPIALGEATRRLRTLCMEEVFQPQTRGQPPIQILGVLESTGLQFDALWVMGLHDRQWPAAARPNPLLPAAVQRQIGSPHASAEVELAFAQAVHQRLLTAAPQITLSYAEQDAAENLRPSPLLAGLSITPETPVAHAAELPAERFELIDDWRAPPTATGEKISGGTGLLRAQAICPAWGYFQYRLGATALKTPSEGLDAMERGTLVHGALEAFWRDTHDSATLQVMQPAQLEAAIASAVETALEAHATSRHRTLPPRTRQLESSRLQRLLARWLEFEKTAREAPFTVLVCEQESLTEIEGIRVRTIIDRVDQLSDGRLLVIDYKTGQRIDTRNWASARITEPQLPIYAAIALPLEDESTQVAGVAFAKVLLDEPGFAGVTEESGLLPKVTGLAEERQRTFDAARFPDWQHLMEHWYLSLQAIAREVREGDARVSFTDAGDLKYCEMLPLLRLAERQEQLEARA